MAGDQNPERKTRLARLDLTLNSVVQIEIPAGLTSQQAKERALSTLNAAIRRAESDSAVKIERSSEEKFYDPSGDK